MSSASGFIDGSWTEPLHEDDDTVELKVGRSIFNDAFKSPAADELETSDESVFLASSPTKLVSKTPAHAHGHSGISTPAPSGSPGETILPQVSATKRTLAGYVDGQTAVRPTGEQLIHDICSNVIMTDTPLDSTFKHPKPKTLVTAYTELRKNSDFLLFEEAFVAAIANAAGLNIRLTILKCISTLQQNWLCTDEQAYTMIYLMIGRASRSNAKVKDHYERIQNVFIRYQHVQINQRSRVFTQLKSGVLPVVQASSTRFGLFRQIQCARDNGIGQFENEFIDLFDSIVTYLTAVTFTSFNISKIRAKIQVSRQTFHALWQLVYSDGTIEKLDIWWGRVYCVLTEIAEVEALSGVAGLMPSLYDLNSLLYTCMVPQCYTKALVPAVN
jgi:hypothetical protein